MSDTKDNKVQFRISSKKKIKFMNALKKRKTSASAWFEGKVDQELNNQK